MGRVGHSFLSSPSEPGYARAFGRSSEGGEDEWTRR